MILSLLSFPLPPSAICTIFGELGLPCLVTSPCVSLSTCPVSSGLSVFALSGGPCPGKRVAVGRGRGRGGGGEGGEGGGGRRVLSPSSPCKEVLGVSHLLFSSYWESGNITILFELR